MDARQLESTITKAKDGTGTLGNTLHQPSMVLARGLVRAAAARSPGAAAVSVRAAMQAVAAGKGSGLLQQQQEQQQQAPAELLGLH